MSEFRTGLQLAKPPCPICWERLDKFVPVHGGRSQNCNTCDNFWKSVPIDTKPPQRSFLVPGAFDFQKQDEEPRFVHMLRFSEQYFPGLNAVQRRLLQKDSILRELPVISPYFVTKAEEGAAHYIRFSREKLRGPCRVVRLEPGLFAVCKNTQLHDDGGLILAKLFEDYSRPVAAPAPLRF